jgi:hypothetical protein
MNINKLRQLFALFKEADELRKQELQEFLDFYKAIVEIVPAEAAKQFGNMTVKVITTKDNTERNYGLMLTVVDYAWWVDQIKYNKVRIVGGPADVKQAILNRMSETIESYLTSAEHKKALMELLVGE